MLDNDNVSSSLCCHFIVIKNELVVLVNLCVIFKYTHPCSSETDTFI